MASLRWQAGTPRRVSDTNVADHANKDADASIGRDTPSPIARRCPLPSTLGQARATLPPIAQVPGVTLSCDSVPDRTPDTIEDALVGPCG